MAVALVTTAAQSRRVRFDAFEVDLRSHELFKGGIRIKLQDQPFQILAILLERPGEMVSRAELRRRLWANDTFVDFDPGLNAAIRRLRSALNDSAEHPRYIETLPRHGYRFLAALEACPTTREAVHATSVAVPAPTAHRPMGVNTGARRIAWILGLAIFGLIAVAVSLKTWRERMFATRALTNIHLVAASPLGDFNQDGKADVVLAVNGGVNVLLGQGDGTFQTSTKIMTGQATNSVKLADLNGDGNLDLALSNGAPSSGNVGDNDVVVILGNGDGTFQPAVKYTAGNNPFLAVVGDVNGDSKPDLIVLSDSGLEVLLGNGDGSFQIPLNLLRSSRSLRE